LCTALYFIFCIAELCHLSALYRNNYAFAVEHDNFSNFASSFGHRVWINLIFWWVGLQFHIIIHAMVSIHCYVSAAMRPFVDLSAPLVPLYSVGWDP